MSSISAPQTLTGMAPEQAELDEQSRPQPGDFIYQAATILAILLCLINF